MSACALDREHQLPRPLMFRATCGRTSHLYASCDPARSDFSIAWTQQVASQCSANARADEAA